MRQKFYAILVLLFIFANVHAQEHLFSYNGIYTAKSTNIVTRATKLRLDRTVLETLYQQQPAVVRIAVPVENEMIILNLKKADLFKKNFRVVVSNTLAAYAYTPGYYLQGAIEGESNSMAAISIFDDFAGGVISYHGETYNLVIANNKNDHESNDYMLYSDKNYTAQRPKCFTQDDNKMPFGLHKNSTASAFVGCPVDVYFETAYDIFDNEGSVQNVMNYLTIVFNGEQALYSNENIVFQIREIKVWVTTDPEASLTTTSDVLNSFSSRMGTSGFNGDLAHYVTFNLGGGVAWVDVLCNSGNRTGVSGAMSPFYSPYPNFSFSVEVITHEMGHNLGSRHTQNCSWPGGAIDDCYPTEGGCPPGPTPINGGTIMSYCHLTSTGINFANGFGPLPGNLVRTKVTDAATSGCICDCDDIQLDITKQDIGCGNPTGSASADVTGGTGPFTYLWSNGAITQSVTGLATGTYYVTVKGSTPNCKVIRGFKILSSGNVTTVSLTPSATSVNRCISDPYTISASISPSGAYTYQWYKNGNPVAGATTTSININSSTPNTSTYYLVANGGTCSGQSPTVTVNFQAVTTPVITAAGPTAICENGSVSLSIPASPGFLIEWRLNGTPIAGATGVSYNATLPGTYTARRYSATSSSCSAISSPVIVTTKPKPDAQTNVAAITICAGKQSTIMHTQIVGETYSWYKNNAVIAGANSSSINVTSAGNYYLQVLGTNGCKNSSAITVVTVNPLPNATLTPATSITLCDGGTLKLDASPLPQAIYTWFNGGSQVASGSANELTVSSSGTYTVQITNSVTGCAASSPATFVTITPPPVIFAGNDTVLVTGQSYTLHVKEISSLGIDHYEWTPSTGLNDAGISNPTTTLMHDQEYTVKGIHPSGCTAIDKVLIKVFKGPAIYIPSAFSPNGDNVNDILHITSIGLKAFNFFDVFNRYGQRIFHSSSATAQWDGQWQGKPLDAGTYVYIADGIDYKGKHITTKGTITIFY